MNKGRFYRIEKVYWSRNVVLKRNRCSTGRQLPEGGYNMKEEYISILKHEFSAEEGSFLLQLRIRSHWDTSAFDRLTKVMLQCRKLCKPNHSTQETSLPVQAMLFPIGESLQKQYCTSTKSTDATHPSRRDASPTLARRGILVCLYVCARSHLSSSLARQHYP